MTPELQLDYLRNCRTRVVAHSVNSGKGGYFIYLVTVSGTKSEY
jgi:hypothetical protein